VHDRVTTGGDALERHGVEEVDALVLDVRSPLAQLPCDVVTDEPRRARDVDLQRRSASRTRPSAQTGHTMR
jgi:hypothetical protein